MAVAAWAAAACTNAPTGPSNLSARHPADLSQEWTLTSPTRENVDSAEMGWALDHGFAIRGLTSLLVVRHSHLIAERYFVPGGPDSLYSARSVTKSVMALLMGIAIQNGAVPSERTPISTYFFAPLPTLDSIKGSITVHDLLTMTSGFAWNEEGNPAEYDDWISAKDQIAYLVRRPLACPPGECWDYNSAAAHLTSVVITQAIAAGTPGFADTALFRPLGFHPVQWEILSGGFANGAAGLYLRPRDMAKIGALMLQQGWSAKRSIVRTSWIQELMQSQWPTNDALPSVGPLTYGELWWTGQLGQHQITLAWGFGGQYIWVVPDLDLVVITTARWRGLGDLAYGQASAIADYVATVVIPAVRAD